MREEEPMYRTKVIEGIGDMEAAAQAIDECGNQMEKEGYALVACQYFADSGKAMLTFRKALKKSFV